MNDILEVTDLTVTFGSVQALSAATLTLRSGEVHGLLGHNGSGKSTLIKTLAGINTPSAGSIRVGGRELHLPVTPAAAKRNGFAFVHQGLGLAQDLSVLENIAVTRFTLGRLGRINWKEQARKATRELELFQADIPLSATVRDLSPVHQAIVAIVRALSSVEGAPGTRTLVLDEPTVYLARHEVRTLFDAVRAFTSSGDAVLFVSHRIDEVLELTDRLTVLRSGSVVATERTDALTEDQIVALIVGRDLNRVSEPAPLSVQAPVCATLVDITSDRLHGVSLEIHEGEILGVTGLAGSGFADLPYIVAGSRPGTGSIEFRGEKSSRIDLSGITSTEAILGGLALVPADRPRLGVVSELSIRENVTMPWLGSFFRGGRIREREESAWASGVLATFGVRFGRATDPIKTLSGGNQQKAVVGKWLAKRPRLLALHEPTQGVDIGGRFEIYGHLRAAAAAGTAVIAASESPEELAELCNRVVIIKEGRVDRILSGAEVDKHIIVEATLTESRAV